MDDHIPQQKRLFPTLSSASFLSRGFLVLSGLASHVRAVQKIMASNVCVILRDDAFYSTFCFATPPTHSATLLS